VALKGTNRLAREINRRLAGLTERNAKGMRALRREYSGLLAAKDAAFVIQLAMSLLGQSDGLCRIVAYELISHHRAARESLTPKHVVALGRGLNSWSSVDGFACHLSGPAWRDGQIPDDLVLSWTKSPDRWWRRAALVSTVALSRRGEDADVRRVIKICRTLSSDPDDMVVKAMSWALRELGKKNPRSAREFLVTHKETLAARVLREVENKLSTGLKNPRRRPANDESNRGSAGR
jgi:3-methyladenine DNA glycosylase AlkD